MHFTRAFWTPACGIQHSVELNLCKSCDSSTFSSGDLVDSNTRPECNALFGVFYYSVVVNFAKRHSEALLMAVTSGPSRFDLNLRICVMAVSLIYGSTTMQEIILHGSAVQLSKCLCLTSNMCLGFYAFCVVNTFGW